MVAKLDKFSELPSVLCIKSSLRTDLGAIANDVVEKHGARILCLPSRRNRITMKPASANLSHTRFNTAVRQCPCRAY